MKSILSLAAVLLLVSLAAPSARAQSCGGGYDPGYRPAYYSPPQYYVVAPVAPSSYYAPREYHAPPRHYAPPSYYAPEYTDLHRRLDAHDRRDYYYVPHVNDHAYVDVGTAHVDLGRHRHVHYVR